MSTTTAPAPASAPAGRPVSKGPLAWRLIHAETRKLLTLNTWWIFGICTLATTAVALLINCLQANYEIDQAIHPPDFGGSGAVNDPQVAEQIKQQQEEWARDHNLQLVLIRSAASIFTSGQFFGLLFILMIGTIMVTNEFAHQTATTTFLTTPKRTEVILAKFAAGIGIAGLFWFVTTAIDLGVGTLFFQGQNQSAQLGEWDVQRAILFNLLAYAIWAILGVGFGVLIRSQIGATITGAALYLPGTYLTLIFFYLIHQFVIKEDWVLKAIISAPAMASAVMVSADPSQIWPEAPDWWVGLLVLIAWGTLAAVIGTLITRKRDIS